MKRLFTVIIVVVLAVLTIATIGGSYYMLDYALAPDGGRADTTARFASLYEQHPEVRPWVDSLRAAVALTDTFAVMPTGERHHAFVISQQQTGGRTAIVIHGWRDQAIGMFRIARLYELMGYRVVVPDLHAHGLSEGEAIGMGWKERLDVLHWMKLFATDTMVVHGISMGAATTMNVAGERTPSGIKDIKFVEDCGYTSVWDEFSHELAEDFSLSEFPLMYTTSLLCRLKYGWSFGEASPWEQVKKSTSPMLFIHGDCDDFVPSWMVFPLYESKPGKKQLWITNGSGHAMSYSDYPDEYVQRLQDFLQGKEE